MLAQLHNKQSSKLLSNFAVVLQAWEDDCHITKEYSAAVVAPLFAD